MNKYQNSCGDLCQTTDQNVCMSILQKLPVYHEFQDRQLREQQDESPSLENCGTTFSEK